MAMADKFYDMEANELGYDMRWLVFTVILWRVFGFARL